MHYYVEEGNETPFINKVTLNVFQNRSIAALYITQQAEKALGSDAKVESYLELLENQGSFTIDFPDGYYLLVKECDCEGCDMVADLVGYGLLPDGYTSNIRWCP